MNKIIITIMIVSCFLLKSSTTEAQIEVAQLSMKKFSAFGFGGFFNIAVPVSEGNAITGEIGLYSFKQADDNIILVPFLLGYRHTLNGSGYGLYVEPSVGYTVGGTDFQDDNYKEQKASGATAAIGTGYIFPGRISFNIGLSYKHVFVSGDPSPNMVSLRISHTFSFGRRNDY